MKVYKVTVLVIDHDGLGKNGIEIEMENVHYPNHCMSPHIMDMEEADIGEWHDHHPLNYSHKKRAEFERLFPVVDGQTREAVAANAALIAAAPDLLAACEAIHRDGLPMITARAADPGGRPGLFPEDPPTPPTPQGPWFCDCGASHNDLTEIDHAAACGWRLLRAATARAKGGAK